MTVVGEGQNVQEDRESEEHVLVSITSVLSLIYLLFLATVFFFYIVPGCLPFPSETVLETL